MMAAKAPLFRFDWDSTADMMFQPESSITSKRKKNKNPLDTSVGFCPDSHLEITNCSFQCCIWVILFLLGCTENIVTCNLVERHYPGLPPLAIWSRIASDQEYRCMTYEEPPFPHSPGFSILILLLSMTVCGVM